MNIATRLLLLLSAVLLVGKALDPKDEPGDRYKLGFNDGFSAKSDDVAAMNQYDWELGVLLENRAGNITHDEAQIEAQKIWDRARKRYEVQQSGWFEYDETFRASFKFNPMMEDPLWRLAPWCPSFDALPDKKEKVSP